MPGLAALQYVSTEFDTTGPRLLGRHSASEGFLKAWVRHSGADPLTCWAGSSAEGEHFAKKVASFGSTAATARSGIGAERALMEAGALWLADPSVGAFTWYRRAHGQKLWSIVGITHTTASDNAMDRIAALMTTPVQSWDALICTSKSVRATVTTMLEAQKEYLAARLGAQRFDTCQLPVIPLGVHCDDFTTTPDDRARWREELGIPEDGVAILQVARLTLFGKAHPVPLYLALDAAARKTGRKVHLILAGWFPSQQQEEAFQAIADQFAETIVTHVVDGRRTDVRRTIWAAADIFTLLVDNIQETFGLAPVEAMAAGLPVVVSDWDGFRDTVTHGETGFLVPSMQPLPGAGSHLEIRYAMGIDEYNGYIGATTQSTSIDLARAAEAFETLITNPALRATMSEAARRRARLLYDWPVVIGQYRDLLAELAERRKAATEETAPLLAGKAFRPDRGDPYTLFESYPTAPLGIDLPIRRLSAGPAEVAAVAGGLQMTMAAPHLLPAPAALDAILARLGAGDATLRTLFDAFPNIHRRILTAGVMWLIKYGFATTGR